MTISLLCSQQAYLWWSFMAKDLHLQPFTVRISSAKEISSVWLIFCPHQGFIKVSLTFDCSVLCSLNPYPRHLRCTKDADVEGRMGKTLQAMERTRIWPEGRGVHLQSHPRVGVNSSQAGIIGGSRFRLTEWRQVRGKHARHAAVRLQFQLQETEAWESWDKVTLGYIVSYKLA